MMKHGGRPPTCRLRLAPFFTIAEYTQAGPVYTAVDIFTDQGSQHFKEHPDGRPSLAQQLLAYLQHWQVSHLIGDATGVGEGLLNWLASALGETAVTPFKFTARSKAQLGVDFLALVETNRFKYWQEETEFDDAWWYFAQANHCTYALDPGRPLETHLRWFVPATTRISTPTGPQALHDDRLISAALIAEADKLIREGKIHTGLAHSIISAAYDPLDAHPGEDTDPEERASPSPLQTISWPTYIGRSKVKLDGLRICLTSREPVL